MANKSLFSTKRNKQVPVVNTVNRAGAGAYRQSDKNAVAQYCVTCTFNGTYYASGQQLLDEMKKMILGCDDEFLLKAALYSRKVGKMKDMPAYILAELTARKNQDALAKHFDEIINNTKMLRNYTQFVRSGVLGRKSFGTGPRNLIREWLTGRDVDRLFYDSVGDNPSLGNIIKWSHPKPLNKKQEALFGWLIGKEVERKNMPKLLKQFEDFKKDNTKEVPAVDFRRLTSLNLTEAQWKEIGYHAGWNMIRMNLNTFLRHGCFKDSDFVDFVANKLSDKEEIAKSLVFPYQLFTTYLNIDGSIPVSIKNALQEAVEISTKNVPNYDTGVVVAVDTSGSMGSPITGHRIGSTSKMRCVDVAGLIASSILRTNKQTLVVPFDTQVHVVDVNPYDSVTTNAKKFARNGGGTDCGSALRYLNGQGHRANLVIYVSDNESWYNEGSSSTGGFWGRATNMVKEWTIFKSRNPKAKMVCIDLTPNSTVQNPNNRDVLNVGGFSDTVFSVIENFKDGDSGDFSKIIENWYENRMNFKENAENGLDSEEE